MVKIGDILGYGSNIVVVVKIVKPTGVRNNIQAVVVKGRHKSISITGVGRGCTDTDLTVVSYGVFLRAVANEAMKMFNKTSKHGKLNVKYN